MLKGTRMLRLVFTICMMDAPDTCEQREMLVYDQMPVAACAMGALPELATWRATHPNWRISRWWCEDDRAAQAGIHRDRPGQPVPPVAGAEARGPGAVPIALSR
jgi:hypothetical protein